MFLFLQPVVVTIFRFLNNNKNSTNIHVHWTLDFNHKRSNWVTVQYIQYLKMCNTWTLNNLVAAAWIRVKNLNIWYTSWCSICYTKPSFFKRLNTVPIWVKQQDGEVLIVKPVDMSDLMSPGLPRILPSCLLSVLSVVRHIWSGSQLAPSSMAPARITSPI